MEPRTVEIPSLFQFQMCSCCLWGLKCNSPSVHPWGLTKHDSLAIVQNIHYLYLTQSPRRSLRVPLNSFLSPLGWISVNIVLIDPFIYGTMLERWSCRKKTSLSWLHKLAMRCRIIAFQYDRIHLPNVNIVMSSIHAHLSDCTLTLLSCLCHLNMQAASHHCCSAAAPRHAHSSGRTVPEIQLITVY